MKKKNILILCALLVLIFFGCGKKEQDMEKIETNPEIVQNESVEAPVKEVKELFPYESEDGKIKLESLFQFTGFNPDCESEEGENIAGIQVTNISEQHLAQAKFMLTLEDGTLLEFDIFDVPAGRSVMAFSNENVTIDSVETCQEIECETSFEDETPLLKDQLKYEVNGIDITITNISGEDLTAINVYCHSVLDATYFGGVTYCYVIDLLEAGQSIVVNAIDCIMGETDVVRMDIN